MLLSSIGGKFSHLSTNTRPADVESFEEAASLIVAAIPSIAAKTFRLSKGENTPEVNNAFSYCENFLHMMFGNESEGTIDPSVSKAWILYFFCTRIMSKTVQPQLPNDCIRRSKRLLLVRGSFSPMGTTAWWGQYGGH